MFRLSTAIFLLLASALGAQSLQPMVAKNRKGLGGIHPDPKLFPDLVELGVGHITVNIMLNTVSSPAQIRQRDRLLKFAHDNDIVVSAILLTPRKHKLLSHPDCDASAKYAMPNVTNPAGEKAYRAAIAALAKRYCQPGFPHGRISHWIVGNEVDSGWIWTNAGEKTATDYMDIYVDAMKITHDEVQRFDPHGTVYISLTHYWNSTHGPNPKRFYKPRQLLEILAAKSKAMGGFNWGVAYHPYAQSLFRADTWNDKTALADYDTPRITMKNIAVLDRYMHEAHMLRKDGSVRPVLLSEQGYHTPDSSMKAQRLQATAIAYAWKQMDGLKSIKAFHYHRWIDHEREGGLNLGLWTVKPGSTTWPAEKKRSWQVYRALGTPAQKQAIAFAPAIIGIESWQDLKP